MKRLLLALLVLLAISACNLDNANSARETSMNATQAAIPVVTAIPLVPATGGSVQGEQGAQGAQGVQGVQGAQGAQGAQGTTPGIPATPVLQSNQTATSCGKLRVNVGTDPGNTLRLRDQPNNSATVILLIPNNSLVTRVATSQDVAADGHTWVNIQYTDPNGVVTTGWGAKDAMKTQLTLIAEGC